MLDGFSIWTRLLIFVLGVAIGFFFLLKPLFIVNILGKSEWAETKVPGGTFGAIKLFGIFIMAVAIVVAIG
jgi:hypothetical protein